MKRYVVISTYPEAGSKNIGDHLIARTLVQLIRRLSVEEAQIDVVWRAASWDEVGHVILRADHVFFACLAIRPALGAEIYPFAQKILDSGKSYSVHAAGTDLKVAGGGDLFGGLDQDSAALLRALAAGATAFTTRGVLTQELCLRIGAVEAEFEGDLAFYDPSRHGLPFEVPETVGRIVISDPHRADRYIESFETLVFGLLEEFPQASVSVALHGVNPVVEDFCTSRWIDVVPIYEDPEGGLEIYEECDLHAGFRVHGHVTALRRRRPSYLLEQDGRGTDYALTLSRRLSVPNYPQLVQEEMDLRRSTAPSAGPQQLLAMIRQDRADGFLKFEGLGEELTRFSQAAEERVARVLAGIGEEQS